MIPYVEWKTVVLGPVTLQVWGFFAALGVVIASAYALREAKRKGLDTGKVETLIFWTIVWAFVGARLMHVLAYDPFWYAARPLEALKVWNGGWSSFGGFFGAASAFFWQMRKSDLPLMKTADVLVRALPLGLGCGRIGCFLIHDHPGTLAYGAGKWLAVNYPDAPRYDLGVLLGIFDFILFGALFLLLRKPRRDGFLFALFMVVYGPARFSLDFLRASDVRYLGLTPGQYASIALCAAGAWLLFRSNRRTEVS